MSVHRNAALASPWVSALLLVSCGPIEPAENGSARAEAAPITNRLDVPPEVVNNLGITFAAAIRGRLGVWEEVPGELRVPEHRRWTVRSPVRARVISVLPRWQVVEAGAIVAVLRSPEIQQTQRAISLAERTQERAHTEVAAAGARLAESEAHILEARSFEEASRTRLHELQALQDIGNALTARDILAARQSVTEASKASLDAAVARDGLVSTVATRQIEADQARLAVEQELSALALMTGTSVDVLAAKSEEGPAWRRIDTITLLAPSAGTIVELLVSEGEFVEAGDAIAGVYDTSELDFHGHLPEGDLGLLTPGAPVRIEFPSRRLAPVETRMAATLPVADDETRMIHVTAHVANPDRVLPDGISVTARVRVHESASEEVLIPGRCVVFDGLEAIVFKRDPGDPSVVIRTLVELGARAAGQIEVLAGVLDGEEVVADGVHQLKQTGLGKAPEGGHFHADGTWHNEHEK